MLAGVVLDVALEMFFLTSSTKTPKAVLQEQKEALQRRLEVINQQLENS